MNKIIKGGFLAGHRTYIISGVGILSAIGAYLVGDTDIFTMLQAIFTVYVLYNIIFYILSQVFYFVNGFL